MERPTPSDMMPKRDHERDLELDKKIEALRRKNEALMKRYKEVEEDKKRAEEEGMALQSRKGKADDLTITISKSATDNRVVVTKPFSAGSPAGKEPQEAGPDRAGEAPPQGAGRGHRKHLLVTMAGKKGKRVVSERPEKRPGPADVKSPADDGQARRVESTGRGKQQPHTSKRDTAAAAPQDDDKPGQKLTEENQKLSEPCQDSESLQTCTDLNIPTSKEEQEEYLRWKKEREQIDRERVARHKNAKGQWRRAWDMDKTENMFSGKIIPDRDWGPSNRGGRSTRRGQSRTGHDKRGKDKGAKNVPAMSSKAKGIDRLTGRARRWQANEEGENSQSPDTTLEEFLEELDALTDADVEDQTDQESKIKLSPSPESLNKSEEMSAAILRGDTPTQRKAEASSPRGFEKKVRFSEELIQGSHTRQTIGSQDSVGTDPRSVSSLKASSPKKQKHKAQGAQQLLESTAQDYSGHQHQGDGQEPPETESAKKDTTLQTAPRSPSPEKAIASLQESCAQVVELAKSNISNTNAEELIDSGLSVLSLESGETHPTHSTSIDKAREHGKIV